LQRFLNFRLRWIDLPMLVICLCPWASSLSNDLGMYDGFAAALSQTLHVGIPYLVGRLYFASRRGLHELAKGIFIGGLVYVPLCLIEIRLSPQMHGWIYGGYIEDFNQTMRFGGYRPVLFLGHGLATSMWMAASALSGLWLWKSGTEWRFFKMPMWVPVGALFCTTILCKSTGAILLFLVGVGILTLAKWGLSKPVTLVFLLVPFLYVAGRLTVFTGAEMTALAGNLGEDRAGSLDYRLKAEDMFQRHAMKQPLLGWGGWGRNRPGTFSSEVENLATDGLWIIQLGCYGLVGLGALLLSYFLPGFLLLLKLPERGWTHPWSSPAAIMAIILAMVMIDNTMNDMPNSVFQLAMGGLAGAVSAPQAANSGSWAQSSAAATSRTPLGTR
jgi:hypothetical protein